MDALRGGSKWTTGGVTMDWGDRKCAQRRFLHTKQTARGRIDDAGFSMAQTSKREHELRGGRVSTGKLKCPDGSRIEGAISKA